MSQAVNTDLKINKPLHVPFSNTAGIWALGKKKKKCPEPDKEETEWFGQASGMSFPERRAGRSLRDPCRLPGQCLPSNPWLSTWIHSKMRWREEKWVYRSSLMGLQRGTPLPMGIPGWVSSARGVGCLEEQGHGLELNLNFRRPQRNFQTISSYF